MKIHLLRGRIAIRPIKEEKRGNLFLPVDWERHAQKQQGIRAKASHWAKVLGMGPPAIGVHGHEVPHGFNVGDTINYAAHIHEKAYEDHVWEDGLPCEYIAQEHVNGVLE